MMNWLRRVDPAFYNKEPHVMRSGAQIPRYGDDAQVQMRLELLRADWFLYVATTIVGMAAYAIIAMPAVWMRADVAMLAVALVVVGLISRVRGRLRAALTVVAVGAFFGVHAHPLSVAPLVAMLAAGATVIASTVIAREWRSRPQVLTWAALAALLLVCAYAMTFNAPVIALHLAAEMAATAVGFLGICVIAGRIQRAELAARPEGVLSLPQSVVPLLDRSHDHAVICWLV